MVARNLTSAWAALAAEAGELAHRAAEQVELANAAEGAFWKAKRSGAPHHEAERRCGEHRRALQQIERERAQLLQASLTEMPGALRALRADVQAIEIAVSDMDMNPSVTAVALHTAAGRQPLAFPGRSEPDRLELAGLDEVLGVVPAWTWCTVLLAGDQDALVRIDDQGVHDLRRMR